MEIVREIFEICIEKNLHFDFSPHVNNITVYDSEHSFMFYSYYSGELTTSTGGSCRTLSELLEIVKEYKP